MLQYAIDGTAPDLSGREALLWDEAQEQIDRQRAGYDRQQAPNVTRRNEALRRRDEGVTPRNEGVEKAFPLSPPTPPVNTPTKERKKTLSKERAKERPLSPALDDAVRAFKEMRTKMRKPMTELAVKLMLDRLERMAPGDEQKQVAMIMQSVENGWTGVYELKQDLKRRERNTLKNYRETGVSHPDLDDIELNMEEL